MGEVIKMSSRTMRDISIRNDAMLSMNQKLVRMRQMHLLKCLQESTEVRVEILQKIRNWINILESRIFNPDVINQMDLNKVMALFRFVGQFSLKLLAQMNDVESLMKTYIETSNSLAALQRDSMKGGKKPDDVNDMKKEILKNFMDALNKNVEEAEVSKPEAAKPEEAIDISPKKDDSASLKNIDNTLPDIDSIITDDLKDLPKI